MKYIQIKVEDRKIPAYEKGKAVGYTCAGVLWIREFPFYSGQSGYTAGNERIYKEINIGWWRAMLDDPGIFIGPFESLQKAMQEDAWKAAKTHLQQQARQLAKSNKARGEYLTVDGKSKYIPIEEGRWELVPAKDTPTAQ